MTRTRRPVITPAEYRTLSELRYLLRRFVRAREIAARAAGIEAQHYLLLLQVKGLDAVRPATIATLAERLQLRHHTVVELVDRLAARGLVARRRTQPDRREVVIELRAGGERVLDKLAEHSLAELRTEGPALLKALEPLVGRPGRRANSHRRSARSSA
jgi:DNA-binding MarR family transcriptional regulator